MSQSRTRKVSATNREKRPSSHVSTAYLTNVHAKNTQPERKSRSKSKNTIPKTVRYELENALVGLCDVWFEEIKPHLVRNNIKLHVHGADADEGAKSGGRGATSGDDSAAGCASGDYRPSLPANALGCNHIDPGAAPDRPQPKCASYAGCCSTRLAVSKSLCLKPPSSHPPRQPPPQQVRQSRRNTAKRRKCEGKRSRCSSPAAVENFHGHHRLAPKLSKQPFDDTYFRDIFRVEPPKLPRRKVMMKNRSTQVYTTGQQLNVASQTENTHDSQNSVMSPVISPNYRWRSLRQNRTSNHKCRESTNIGESVLLKKSKNTSNKEYRESTYIEESVSLKKSKSTYNKEFQASTNIEESVLFPDDLIDIIADKSTKELKNNYNKSDPDGFSFMNLVSSPRHCKKKTQGRTNGAPWR